MAFSRISGLYCRRKSMVWKTFLGTIALCVSKRPKLKTVHFRSKTCESLGRSATKRQLDGLGHDLLLSGALTQLSRGLFGHIAEPHQECIQRFGHLPSDSFLQNKALILPWQRHIIPQTTTVILPLHVAPRKNYTSIDPDS